MIYRTAYFISSQEGPLPREGFAALLDCGLLTHAPSLQSLEQASTLVLPCQQCPSSCPEQALYVTDTQRAKHACAT